MCALQLKWLQKALNDLPYSVKLQLGQTLATWAKQFEFNLSNLTLQIFMHLMGMHSLEMSMLIDTDNAAEKFKEKLPEYMYKQGASWGAIICY